MNPALLAVVLSAVVAADEGGSFVSRDDAFQVTFPGQPKVATQFVTIEGQRVEMRMYEVTDRTAVWSVAVTSIDGSRLDLMKLLQDTQRNIVKNGSGTVTREKVIRIGQYQGMDARIEIPGGFVMILRHCVTPRRRYTVHVMFVAEEEEKRRGALAAFLTSFSPE